MWEEREEDERLVALVSAVGAQLGTLFQQKQAEEALRASEEHFRAVADTAADAILSLDAQGNVAYANAAASRIFGQPVEKLTGRPVTELLPGGMPAADIDEPSRLVEVTGRRRRAAERRGRVPARGCVLALERRGRDASPPPCCATSPRASATRRPCTRRRSGSAARSSRRRSAWRSSASRAIARAASCGSTARCARSSATRPRRWSASSSRRSSTPPTRTPPTPATSPGCWPGRSRSFEVEKRLRRADGETIVAMVSVSLVPDAQERPLYLIVQVQDVTARTRAEAALRREQRAGAGDHRQHGRGDLRQGHGGPLHAREPQLRGAVRHRARARHGPHRRGAVPGRASPPRCAPTTAA